jgi:hypothetical protein
MGQITLRLDWLAGPGELETLVPLARTFDRAYATPPGVGDRVFVDDHEQLAVTVRDRLLHNEGSVTLRLDRVYGSDGWDLELLRSWGYTDAVEHSVE